MIVLTEVAKKLEEILNSQENSTTDINPVPYIFQAATEGYHLDNIINAEKGTNFIPVFVSSLGGEYNPVPNLQQASYRIQVSIFFPVRFKEDFYNLTDYLVDSFVGRKIKYGENSGEAISNISSPEYAELQNIELKQFKTWAENIYRQPIEEMEKYMQMNFVLYLSSVGEDYIYGNDVSVSLHCGSYGDEEVSFTTQNIQSTSEPNGQQLLGNNEGDSMPLSTAYSSGFSVFVKNTNFYKYLINEWCKGNAQDLEITLKITFESLTRPFSTEKITFERTCYLSNASINIEKGQPLTLAFTFTKKAEI